MSKINEWWLELTHMGGTVMYRFQQKIKHIKAKVKDWNKGMLQEFTICPWNKEIFYIDKYIICEGHFGLISHYYIRLLPHLKDKDKVYIHFPYFQWKNLTKMETTI